MAMDDASAPDRPMCRPLLVRHARYRWDELRRQHQLVFPEGLLVLNDTGAAIVRLCDGRSLNELLAALGEQFAGRPPADEVAAFLQRLVKKGLLREAPAEAPNEPEQNNR
jgi:pyrroloquinoline quinone biosynthesis protein D